MSTTLRHAEYYDMQSTFDDLYERSKNNAIKGVNLYELIISQNNILLAYRNIKANTGSKTAGTDGITIEQYKIEDVETFVDEIRTALKNYKPQTVRRVDIPKPNGKTRPLGIPTMRDRLIQQMFKQILEPICEARFYNHSYGFRPNRSTHHAIARCQYLANLTHNHHVVDIDIDIQGFFDNVSHSKLLKQMYNIGISDKRVLSVVSKMLKAPYADNRISRYSMQSGKCAITGEFLVAEEVHCHHRTPRHMGGTDEFKNLVIVHKNAHRLIHATESETIERYKSLLQLDGKQLKKLN